MDLISNHSNLRTNPILQSLSLPSDLEEFQLRPQSLSDYIGQEKIKEKLSIVIQAAKKRNEALDHALFYGPPGLGKTSLAHIISKELGVNIKSTSGPIIEKTGDLAALLTNLEPRQVLFIDEIHRLPSMVEEVLYSAMEDFKLDILVGQGPSAKTIKLDLVPFTLVGATTKAGLLTSPLRDRFGIVSRLDFYQAHELKKIIQRSAQILNIECNEAGALAVAERSRGTPRIANRLLKRVRDFAQVKAQGLINEKVASEALDLFEVDSKGFDMMDRKYLLTLIQKFKGGPVGLETLASALGEEKGTVEDMIEPYLIQEGFIHRTPRGREASSFAYSHFGVQHV